MNITVVICKWIVKQELKHFIIMMKLKMRVLLTNEQLNVSVKLWHLLESEFEKCFRRYYVILFDVIWIYIQRWEYVEYNYCGPFCYNTVSNTYVQKRLARLVETQCVETASKAWQSRHTAWEQMLHNSSQLYICTYFIWINIRNPIILRAHFKNNTVLRSKRE